MGTVINWRERKAYWRHTKWQMAATLLPFIVALLVVPHYADALNARRFLGAALGFFVLVHGLLIVAAVITIVWVNRQFAIDRWHGAQEDV